MGVLQDASPPAVLAQVIAARGSLLILAAPLGTALGGPLVAALGAGGTLRASALGHSRARPDHRGGPGRPAPGSSRGDSRLVVQPPIVVSHAVSLVVAGAFLTPVAPSWPVAGSSSWDGPQGMAIIARDLRRIPGRAAAANRGLDGRRRPGGTAQ